MREILAISNWSNEALESGHDWVQRAFPTMQRSAVTGERYRLLAGDVEAMGKDRNHAARLRQNAERFLAFMRSDPRAITAGFNHNYQRVTRVIESLNLFGQEDAARAFHSELISAFRSRQLAVPVSDREYWLPALCGKTSVRHKAAGTGMPRSRALPKLCVFGAEDLRGLLAHALGGNVVSMSDTFGEVGNSDAIVLPMSVTGEVVPAIANGGGVVDLPVQERIRDLFNGGQIPIGQGFVIGRHNEGETGASAPSSWFIAIAVKPQAIGLAQDQVLSMARESMLEVLQLAVESGFAALYLPTGLLEGFVAAAGSADSVLGAFSAAYDEVDLQLYDRYGNAPG